MEVFPFRTVLNAVCRKDSKGLGQLVETSGSQSEKRRCFCEAVELRIGIPMPEYVSTRKSLDLFEF